MNIVGAGLSGLIAAHIWPNAKVYEIANGPLEQHKALLRFRSDVVAQVTGIEFKKVKVRKGIFDNGRFCEPTIALSNQYSKKCLGRIEPERSIWNLEPAIRFIAPDDLYQQLVDNCGSRIEWGADYQFQREVCISTIPLPVLIQKVSPSYLHINFNKSPITVQRFYIPNCDAYQTVYFPTPTHSVYRASITGDILIVEHADILYGDWIADVERAFAITMSYCSPLGEVEQKYGKIAPINEGQRKSIIFDMSRRFGIYSLGRFATWRNILLDDVVGDAAVIKRLMRGDHYDLYKESNK